MGDIFWLEDNPEVIDWLHFAAQYHGLDLDMDALLKRITWAFDYEMGKEIVAQEDFNLYILNAGFPRSLGSQRRDYLQDYVNKFKSGSWQATPEFRFLAAPHYEEPFVKFYEECLSPEKKVIVVSMSHDAPGLSLQAGLPFYDNDPLGGFDEEMHEDLVKAREKYRLHFTDKQLEQWEYGGLKELIETYFLSDS